MMTISHAFPPLRPRFGRSRRGLRFAVIAISCCLLAVSLSPAPVLASDYKAENVFAQPPRLLASLQRVVMLPVACASPGNGLSEGCEAMTPVLLDELVRIKKFEVVSVKPDDLRFSTGSPNWTGSEVLSTNFFDTLQRTSGADAVLFSELTEYKAYSPMLIGWRFKLVDIRTRTIIWAADQIFDSRQATAIQNPTLLKRISVKLTHPDEEAWVESVSPQVLGHKTISALLKTLPER